MWLWKRLVVVDNVISTEPNQPETNQSFFVMEMEDCIVCWNTKPFHLKKNHTHTLVSCRIVGWLVGWFPFYSHCGCGCRWISIDVLDFFFQKQQQRQHHKTSKLFFFTNF